MREKTLVLNADYRPIAVVPLHRAVIMIYLETADLVETNGEYLHSQHRAIEVPTVVKLREFARIPFKRRVPVTRRAVLQRDNHTCGYCGGKADTIDHVIPRALGGKHTWLNVVAACRACNGQKGATPLEECGLTLHTKPYEPSGTGALVVAVGKTEPAWEPYLEYA